MVLAKKKWLRRLKSLPRIIFAILLIASAICIQLSAATAAEDALPTMPNASDLSTEAPLPNSNVGTESAAEANPETGDRLSSVLGTVIAVIVVLAVIMLIIALVPAGRKEKIYGSDDRSNRFDNGSDK